MRPLRAKDGWVCFNTLICIPRRDTEICWLTCAEKLLDAKGEFLDSFYYSYYPMDHFTEDSEDMARCVATSDLKTNVGSARKTYWFPYTINRLCERDGDDIIGTEKVKFKIPLDDKAMRVIMKKMVEELSAYPIKGTSTSTRGEMRQSEVGVAIAGVTTLELLDI
ncbi:hypothetical protein ACJIZ3_022036 [Penstemon smallii]|uniref:Uncharacterized protein n=1 Tax=Penstemon smallii TaxID=265156 RepID=A0ABD3SN41_9LAMI